MASAATGSSGFWCDRDATGSEVALDRSGYGRAINGAGRGASRCRRLVDIERHLEGLFGTAHGVGQAFDVVEVLGPDVIAGAVAGHGSATEGHGGEDVGRDAGGALR